MKRPSPLFGPSKFDDRREMALKIVAAGYFEPSQIQKKIWFKKAQRVLETIRQGSAFDNPIMPKVYFLSYVYNQNLFKPLVIVSGP